MRWVLYIGLGLVMIVAVVVIVGSLLPKRHVAARSIILHQPPEVVFALIAGPPTWRQDVRKYEPLSGPEGVAGGKVVWRETDSHGETITYEEVESTPPNRRVIRIADPKLPYGGSWTYELAGSGGGTELKITENGEVYNPVFRFVSKFVMGHTASLDKYLRNVAQHFGEKGAV